jgi:hypothetical protein
MTTAVKSDESFVSVDDHRRQIRRKFSSMLMTTAVKSGESFARIDGHRRQIRRKFRQS